MKSPGAMMRMPAAALNRHAQRGPGWARLTCLGSIVGAALLIATPLGTRAATTPPPLATAKSFAILAGSAVTNTGPSGITGDLGLSPGSSVIGFPPGTVNGGIHVDDSVSVQAKSDLVTAYDSAAGQPCTSTLTGDLGGRTLIPGVYCFTSAAQLTGTLTLDGGGDPNAVFIFKIASALTTASSSRVDLVNGGACGIFWQVGSSATLGTDTNFVGTLLVNTSITLNTRANILPGRALAATGAVTLDSNTIARPPDTCTVATSSTTTSPTSSPNPSLPGAPVVLSATVTSNIPGIAPPGTLIFKEGSTTLGQAPLDSSGNATLTLPPLSAGAHAITAKYLGLFDPFRG
ncbi:MAG: ice-binding family protein [Candidatus Dormibacteria bacterium]